MEPIYEVQPHKDLRGVDLISDALPFGRLWLPERISSLSHLDELLALFFRADYGSLLSPTIDEKRFGD